MLFSVYTARYLSHLCLQLIFHSWYDEADRLPSIRILACTRNEHWVFRGKFIKNSSLFWLEWILSWALTLMFFNVEKLAAKMSFSETCFRLQEHLKLLKPVYLELSSSFSMQSFRRIWSSARINFFSSVEHVVVSQKSVVLLQSHVCGLPDCFQCKRCSAMKKSWQRLDSQNKESFQT